MASNPRKDMLRYWRGIMNDKSESNPRRDKAATMLGMILSQRSKERALNRRLAMKLKQRKAWKEVLKRGGAKAITRDAIGSQDKTRGQPGKKVLKKVAAEEVATSNEWSGLIPSAQVIPMRQRKAK